MMSLGSLEEGKKQSMKPRGSVFFFFISVYPIDSLFCKIYRLHADSGIMGFSSLLQGLNY